MCRLSSGACAIHSIFGDDVSGEFVKANARAFLLEEFGDSAEIFSSRLQDPALFQNVQDVLWKGLLKPLRGGIDNERVAEQEEEGKMIWDQLLHTKPKRLQGTSECRRQLQDVKAIIGRSAEIWY